MKNINLYDSDRVASLILENMIIDGEGLFAYLKNEVIHYHINEEYIGKDVVDQVIRMATYERETIVYIYSKDFIEDNYDGN